MGLIFSCDAEDLKSVVSIGVYRWVCNIGQFVFVFVFVFVFCTSRVI